MQWGVHFCLSSSCQPNSLMTKSEYVPTANTDIPQVWEDRPLLSRVSTETLTVNGIGLGFWLSFFWKLYILIKIELQLCDIHLIKMYYNCWSILLKWFSFSSNRFARWQMWFLCFCKELRAMYGGWGQPWTLTPTPGMAAFFTKLSCSRLKSAFLPNNQIQDK